MIEIEGFDTGIQYEFSNASELLEFLDEQLTRWWMERDLVVSPVGPAYIRISCNAKPHGEKSQ